MSTYTQSDSRFKRIAKSKWSWLLIAVVVLAALYLAFTIRSAITSLEYALTPPDLPRYVAAEQTYLNKMGWGPRGPQDSSWFHHASQGTATLPVPYDWLVALEAPKSNVWLTFLGSEEAFVGEYMLRLGFIKQHQTEQNPDGLPIGLAKTPSIYFAGIDRKAEAIGFTCAACHTGQFIVDDKRYIVDGGPATTDLGLLTQSLGAALGQTALSSKLPVLNGRFDRFADKVLGSNNNVLTKNNLKKQLADTLDQLVDTVDTINVTEGFTRLDALNRIGNQVFDSSMNRPANYSPIVAPVNYPHLWTTSWFNWVQYDGSIMQPLIRNAGEALGVEAFVDTQGPDDQRFASSIDYSNLVKIERWLGGTDPRPKRAFNGLQSPQWPDEFGIDEDLAAHGQALYKDLCQGCHLPPITSDAFWDDRHWQPISYVEGDKTRKTDQAYLHLPIIPVNKIGTDPAQANVLPTRTVDTTGLNLDTDICTPLPVEANDKATPGEALRFVTLQDSATANYGLALGAFVQRTNEQWFKQSFTPPSAVGPIEGNRPNCLQVGKGYKARPLNGVWATAPFLHNGSIANIYDLLSPLDERPTFVELGNQAFDTRKLGVVQSDKINRVNAEFRQNAAKATQASDYKLKSDYEGGLFVLDTREPGNYNTGHIFDDKDKNMAGRINRRLSPEERYAVIEYLKTL